MSIVALDGARKIGAKILVSGGGRCNVTHKAVSAEDFFGGSRNTIRRVLREFSVEQTVAFFREIGVAMHEEETGKLFPNSNSARAVLAALLGEAARRGVTIRTEQRVVAVGPPSAPGGSFAIETNRGTFTAQALVLASGGRSLPKTGSDGAGYALAEALGHTLVAQTPALAGLVLNGDTHAALAGISQEVELAVRVAGRRPETFAGPLLWTHFGLSGPAPMNASRVWHRAALEGRAVSVVLALLPGQSLETSERLFLTAGERQPRSSLRSLLAGWLPARVADMVLHAAGLDGSIALAHLKREDRRRLLHWLLEFPIDVRDSRGYAHAEATAGGVPLTEIDPATMASRRCPGLFLVGEVLNVDGRIGGFNFQWAWSSAYVAAGGVDAWLAAKSGE